MKHLTLLAISLLLLANLSVQAQLYNNSIHLLTTPLSLNNLPNLNAAPNSSLYIQQTSSSLFNVDVNISFYTHEMDVADQDCAAIGPGTICYRKNQGSLMIVTDVNTGNIIEAHYLSVNSIVPPIGNQSSYTTRLSINSALYIETPIVQDKIYFTGDYLYDFHPFNQSIKMVIGQLTRSSTSGPFTLSGQMSEVSLSSTGVQVLEGSQSNTVLYLGKIFSGATYQPIVIEQNTNTGTILSSKKFDNLNLNPSNFVTHPEGYVISGIVEDLGSTDNIECDDAPYATRRIGVIYHNFNTGGSKAITYSTAKLFDSNQNPVDNFHQAKCFVTNLDEFNLILTSTFFNADFKKTVGIISLSNNLQIAQFHLLEDYEYDVFDPRILKRNNKVYLTFKNTNMDGINRGMSFTSIDLNKLNLNSFYSSNSQTFTDYQNSASIGINSYGDYSIHNLDNQLYFNTGNLNSFSPMSKNIVFESKVNLNNLSNNKCAQSDNFYWNKNCMNRISEYTASESNVNVLNIPLFTIESEERNSIVAKCVNGRTPTLRKKKTLEIVTKNLELEVFPNPSSGITRVMISGQIETFLGDIFISDLFGKQVYLRENSTIEKEGTSLDLTSFKKGTYIISIVTSEKTYTSKIVKI